MCLLNKLQDYTFMCPQISNGGDDESMKTSIPLTNSSIVALDGETHSRVLIGWQPFEDLQVDVEEPLRVDDLSQGPALEERTQHVGRDAHTAKHCNISIATLDMSTGVGNSFP